MPPDQVFVLHDLEALKALFDPMRKRIVNELSAEPRTVQQVAEILNVPFTRLYYHFNMLEKHGLIRLVETRTLAGAVEEKFYQVTAYIFHIDRALVSFGEQSGGEGLSAILNLTTENMVQEILNSAQAGVIDLTAKAPDPRALMIHQGMLHLTEAQAERVYETIKNLIEDLLKNHVPDPADKTYGFTLVLYPSVREGQDNET